jgi:N,N'-diacetylchitobiose transport system permease protein
MLDGANEWQLYHIITVPFLRPIISLVTILSVIWDFNVFNQIQILTQGGPDLGTTTIGIWTYQVAFNANAYGQASAIAVLTVIVLVVLTGVYVRRLVREGETL